MLKTLKNSIPANQSLHILWSAVEDCQEGEEINREEVNKALECFDKKCPEGVEEFRKGLEENQRLIQKYLSMARGYEAIKRLANSPQRLPLQEIL